MERELDDLLHCPCPSCGAQLQFSAEKQAMACGHCGYQEPLVLSADRIEEIDWSEAQSDKATAHSVERRLFSCQRCGAKTVVNYDAPTISCGFCGSTNVNPDAVKTRLFEPQGIVPFRISRNQASDSFKKWIGQSIWAPNDLKDLARLDTLHGMYIPFWTYDVQTDSQWSGEAGTYYYVTEQFRDQNGNVQTRQVRNVRWWYKEGTHSQFFDDVLILASRQLPQNVIQQVYPYLLDHVVNYEPKVMLGWEAEVYNIDPKDGFSVAKQQVDQRIESACADKCSDDTYRNLSVRTQYSGQTFKHLVLPLWICAYQYGGKTYQFLINGQTGSISGKRPVSPWKIALAVLAFLALVGLLVMLGGKKKQRSHYGTTVPATEWNIPPTANRKAGTGNVTSRRQTGWIPAAGWRSA
ncbi:MAG: hypothetical protein J7576_09560 [Siphonobacter aquaeclarae]|nr:hypothetical protein [Siphonobacter aquaeclarae]